MEFDHGRGGGRGRGRFNARGGRFGGQRSHQDSSLQSQEPSILNECKFNVFGACNRQSCNRSHSIQLRNQIPTTGVTSFAQYLPPDVLIGSSNSEIQKFNVVSGSSESIPTNGPVTCIETIEDTIFYTVSEAQVREIESSRVGILYILRGSAISATREGFPYSHPQEIRSLKAVKIDDKYYVLTGGAEGMIRLWSFSMVTNSWSHLTAFEGHTRAVQALEINENHLWSASEDCTIRIWELSSGRLLKTISPSPTNPSEGHRAPIQSLQLFSVPDSPPMVASGSVDGIMKIWSSTGEEVQFLSFDASVNVIRIFQDTNGGEPCFFIGFSNGHFQFRVCRTLKLLFSIPTAFFNSSHIPHPTSIKTFLNVGGSYYTFGDDSGMVHVFQAGIPFIDST